MEVLLITRNELKTYIENAVYEAVNQALEAETLLQMSELKQTRENKKLIRGIKGLAAFLNVSVPTAQKMKNDKIFPCIQRGRTIFFKSDEVLSGLSKRNKKS